VLYDLTHDLINDMQVFLCMPEPYICLIIAAKK